MTNVKNIFSYRWLGACQSEIIPRNVSTQVSWLRNDINKDQIPRSVLRLFDNVYCLNQRTPVDNCWPKFATSRKFQQHWPPWAASSSLSTGQHVGAWVDSRSPFVYIRFLSFTGQRRIIHTGRSELWHISKPKSSIKSCFGQNYECVYKVWCQTVALKS